MDSGKLQGRLKEGEFEYELSQVPPNWPGKWEEGEMIFPNVLPEFPENETTPPDHLAMDDVIEFLLK